MIAPAPPALLRPEFYNPFAIPQVVDLVSGRLRQEEDAGEEAEADDHEEDAAPRLLLLPHPPAAPPPAPTAAALPPPAQRKRLIDEAAISCFFGSNLSGADFHTFTISITAPCRRR